MAMALLVGPLASRTVLAQTLREASPEEGKKAPSSGDWLAPYLDFFSSLTKPRAHEGEACRSGTCADSLVCCCCDGVCACKPMCSYKPCR